MTQLKSNEYYWLNSPAIDPQMPLMIGKYQDYGHFQKWFIEGQAYTAGVGIDVIRHIPKPRSMS